MLLHINTPGFVTILTMFFIYDFAVCFLELGIVIY